jgi:hypothetical protein
MYGTCREDKVLNSVTSMPVRHHGSCTAKGHLHTDVCKTLRTPVERRIYLHYRKSLHFISCEAHPLCEDKCGCVWVNSAILPSFRSSHTYAQYNGDSWQQPEPTYTVHPWKLYTGSCNTGAQLRRCAHISERRRQMTWRTGMTCLNQINISWRTLVSPGWVEWLDVTNH